MVRPSKFHDRRGRIFNTANFVNKNRAEDFVLDFTPSFCVYCERSGMLFTQYELHAQENGIVVIPEMYFHTFHLPTHCTERTPLLLVANRVKKEAALYDRKHRTARNAKKSLFDFVVDRDSYPVVLKSSLRRLTSDLPCLAIESIKKESFNGMSKFEKDNIKSAVLEKLSA